MLYAGRGDFSGARAYEQLGFKEFFTEPAFGDPNGGLFIFPITFVEFGHDKKSDDDDLVQTRKHAARWHF